MGKYIINEENPRFVPACQFNNVKETTPLYKRLNTLTLACKYIPTLLMMSLKIVPVKRKKLVPARIS